tara:strand:+ start:16466 stop:16612 length:147 start_codon:yes stop_codon:yes gene_type:complete
MKIKLSVSMDDALVKKAEETLEKGLFRNKSHVIEYALKKFLEDENGRN